MRDRRPTLVELEALRATIAEGTTVAAALRLGRSQSSVSRSLAELEKRLGVRLFRRRSRSIEPSADALAIDRELDQVFAVLDGIRHAASKGPGPAVLSIAAPPAFASALVPKAFASFRRSHPGCVLHLEIMATSAVVARVAETPTVFGMTDSAVSSSSVRLNPFRTSRAHCLLPSGHRLSDRAEVSVSDLAGEPMIALARHHSMRAQIDALFAPVHAGKVAAETSSAVAALELVKAGVGAAVLNPFPLVGSLDDVGIVCVPMRESLVYRSAFLFATDIPPSQIALRFERHLRRFVRDDPWSVDAK